MEFMFRHLSIMPEPVQNIRTSLSVEDLVREPAVGLIKWLRPKGLKVCSYVEKYAELKNQTLKKFRWNTNWLHVKEYPWGDPYHKTASKWGHPIPSI